MTGVKYGLQGWRIRTEDFNSGVRFSLLLSFLKRKKNYVDHCGIFVNGQQFSQTSKHPLSSIRPLPEQHHRNRCKENLQIEEHRLILCVVEIEKDHFTKTDMASSGDLP